MVIEVLGRSHARSSSSPPSDNPDHVLVPRVLTMDIVMLARRCAKNGGEKLERDHELNVAFANMIGEKVGNRKLVSESAPN